MTCQKSHWCSRFHCPSPMYPTDFRKSATHLRFFRHHGLRFLESRREPCHSVTYIIRHFSRNGRAEPTIFSITYIQKKTAFVFHFHEKSAFCSRTEDAIHLSVLQCHESKKALIFLRTHSIQVFGGCGKLFQTFLPEKTVLRHFRHLCIQVFRSSVRWIP